jgi:capsular polysaccharide transport system permease protein
VASFSQSLATQARVIYALVGRDMRTKHVESPLGVFSAVVEPLGTLLVLVFIFSYLRMRDPRIGDVVILFLMTGIFPISNFKGAINGAEHAFNRMRRSLTMKQISPLDLILAGAFSNFIAIAALFYAITLYYVLIWEENVPRSVIMPLVPMAGNMLIGIGFAGINMTIKTWFPFWGRIFSTLMGPIGILSGMFFTAQTLPPQILKYAYWNPLFHATELCRESFFPNYTSPLFDWRYYSAWVFGTFFVGVLCERFFRYRLLLKKT